MRRPADRPPPTAGREHRHAGQPNTSAVSARSTPVSGDAYAERGAENEAKRWMSPFLVLYMYGASARMKADLNFGYAGLQLSAGVGMVFNARKAGDLAGIFLGQQTSFNGTTNVPLGASADGLWGFSWHDKEFTGVNEVDGTASVGLGTKGDSFGVNNQIVGSFYFPLNMPGWTKEF